MTVELIPGEFSPFTIAVAILSGFIVIFGFVSMFVKEKLFISEACKFMSFPMVPLGKFSFLERVYDSIWSLLLVVALLVGIIAGPIAANGFNPYSWNDTDEITKQITRCVIAIQVSKMPCLRGPLLAWIWPDPGDGSRYRATKVSCNSFLGIVHSYLEAHYRHYLKKEWLTMFMLLIPVMLFMWLVSGLFIWALIPPLDYVCLRSR